MKQIAKYFMALTLLAMPFAFQSCSEREDISNYYYYDDLVTEAVNNYWYVYPGGTDYDTAYNWFVHYYPNATAAEFDAFMNQINFGYNNQKGDPIMEEVQVLSGEWAGDMTIEFDGKTGQREAQTFHANMKFWQYASSKNSLGGNGQEVDTAADGSTQTLDFTWYVDKNGDIYIKYKSGTIFRMNASSPNKGFHLGYEKEKGYDTFFGYGISTNTTDVFYIDLSRQSTSGAKGKMIKARKLENINAGKIFGQAAVNESASHKAKAVSGLRAR